MLKKVFHFLCRAVQSVSTIHHFFPLPIKTLKKGFWFRANHGTVMMMHATCNALFSAYHILVKTLGM